MSEVHDKFKLNGINMTEFCRLYQGTVLVRSLPTPIVFSECIKLGFLVTHLNCYFFG